MIVLYSMFWNKKSYWGPDQNDLFNGTEVNFFPQGNTIKKPRSILKEELIKKTIAYE